MPLASAGGSQADGDVSTLPHTPARRSSSGVTPSGSRSGPPGRKGGPSFGPTNIDLDDIETPSSSEAPSEGAAPEDAKTDAPADDATHVGDAGMHGPSDAVTMPNSRMLVNAPRGSMVCLSQHSMQCEHTLYCFRLLVLSVRFWCPEILGQIGVFVRSPLLCTALQCMARMCAGALCGATDIRVRGARGHSCDGLV